MKVLFIRHGESVDDIEDRYGGWADFPLTYAGVDQIKARIKEIEALHMPFARIYTSPLQRAQETADILSVAFDLSVHVFEYLKERNYYGVLSGMKKTDALEKYPDVVATMKQEEYIDGSERLDDFDTRVRRGIVYLLDHINEPVIVATHGNWLKSLFKQFVDAELIKREDGAWVLGELTTDKFVIEQSSGLEWK